TLHIGLDTFRPIAEEKLDQHAMHSEAIEVSAETTEQVNAARQAGGRIVAIGTTAVRTLEAVAALAAQTAEKPGGGERLIIPYGGRPSLFIQPGHVFRAVDVMLTNCHLPRSTLLVLVSAFAGRELILRAYQEAAVAGYRFYSFGDAMLIV